MLTLIDGDLYQWDTGRVLLVEPESGYTIHEVHFTTKKMDFAYVVKTYTSGDAIYCKIPNILLQQYRDIICYEVRENEAGEESVSETTYTVVKRNRPVDYVYTEPEQYTYREFEKRMDELEKVIDSLKENVTSTTNSALEKIDDVEQEMVEKIEDIERKMIKTINNIEPDENGNVVIEGVSGEPSHVDNVVKF